MNKLGCRKYLAAFLILLPVSSTSLFSQIAADSRYVLNATSPMAPATVTIEQYVREVSLVLSVTDHKGRFVGNLQPSDFSILDNDKKQDVLTFFQSETDLPLRVALLLDVSSSVAYRFPLEQNTIGEFFREVARPPDRIAVFAFNQNVQMVEPITNNWKQVSSRVRKLKADGETALYDAISKGSAWLEQDRQPSRHIIILITDGQDNASKSSIDDTISRVLMAEASIYAINVDEDFPIELVKQGTANLKRLADATGGIYLRADTGGTVGRAFARIRRELRSQYALAYRPSNLTDQAFHQLRITVPDNLRVRCRTGYYTK
jgi:Ca-activated chloride channel homolog